MEKPELIKKIIDLTKQNPEKYFDKLYDQSEKYLHKLLIACQKIDAVQN